MDEKTIRSNIEDVRGEIAEAARRAGRDPAEVSLLAVSKTNPAPLVRLAAEAGQTDFGESYVQEALDKLEALDDLDLNWHFIGHLQTNKAKYVTGRFCLVHTVDSVRLAESLHKLAQARNLTQDVLLQVNLALEPQKSGVEERDLPALAEAVAAMTGLRIRGLMIIPPWSENPEDSRPYFARLRQVRDGLEARLGLTLTELSMGMSGDFKVAVEEGSTLVRVGTRIFGARPCAR